MRDMCRETRTGVCARERLDGIRVAIQGAQENAACATERCRVLPAALAKVRVALWAELGPDGGDGL